MARREEIENLSPFVEKNRLTISRFDGSEIETRACTKRERRNTDETPKRVLRYESRQRNYRCIVTRAYYAGRCVMVSAAVSVSNVALLGD